VTPNSQDTTEQSPADASAPETVREAQAEVALSSGSMLRRGAIRWVLMGGVRVVYRGWTRVAARIFPEGTPQARAVSAAGVTLPDRLNMSWITPQLAVGGRIHPDDIARLATIGITRVVDTRSEHRDDEAALAAHGIRLLYLPTPDTEPLTLERLIEGTRWINQQIAAGERVLVHCEHGVGRSVMLVAAALVAGGMNAHDAIRLIQASRWQAAPNHRQMVRLQEFERAVRSDALA
jgi:protein tyrosine phosphatase (PTP) superfamily phosphohydrolase (DUF442 family)